MKTRRKTSSRVLAFLLSFIMVATTFVNDYTVAHAEEGDVTVSDESSSSESSDSSSDSGSDESSDKADSDDAGSSDESDAADSVDRENADDVTDGSNEENGTSDNNSDSADGETTDGTSEDGETTVDGENAEDGELKEEEEIPLEDLNIDEDQIVITFSAREGGSVSMSYQVLGEDDDVKAVMAIADDGYEFVNWTKGDEEVSDDAEFTPAKEDAEYVANFAPVEEEELEFNQSKTVNGVKISLYAKPGVLPNDAELQVKAVSSTLENRIKDAVDAETEESVTDTYSFDINIYSASAGGYVQPEDGTVEVRFDLADKDIDEEASLSVYHVETNSYASAVKNVEEVAAPEKGASEIGFDAEHFSVYTVVIQTKNNSTGLNIKCSLVNGSTHTTLNRSETVLKNTDYKNQTLVSTIANDIFPSEPYEFTGAYVKWNDRRITRETQIYSLWYNNGNWWYQYRYGYGYGWKQFDRYSEEICFHYSVKDTANVKVQIAYLEKVNKNQHPARVSSSLQFDDVEITIPVDGTSLNSEQIAAEIRRVKPEMNGYAFDGRLRYEGNGTGAADSAHVYDIVGLKYDIRNRDNNKVEYVLQYKLNGNEDWIDFSEGPNGKAVLCAHYSDGSKVITYKANGGIGDDVVEAKVDNVDYKIRTNTFSNPSGKSFIEWNTEADGTGTSYAPGAVYKVNEDLTLYAQWGYEVYFYLLKPNMDPMSPNNSAYYPTGNTPEEHYKLKGYVAKTDEYNTDRSKNNIDSIPSDYKVKLSASAISDLNSYLSSEYPGMGYDASKIIWYRLLRKDSDTTYEKKIHYHVDGYIGGLNTKVVYHDGYSDIKYEKSVKSGTTHEVLDYTDITQFTNRPGYEFQGWATSLKKAEDGVIEYHPGDSIPIMSTHVIHLYAVWSENPVYKVTFKLDGGKVDGKTDDVVKTVVKGEYVTPPTPGKDSDSKYSYRFTGWDKDVVNPVNADATYTAQWEKTPIDYNITYNLDGGSLNAGESNPTKYNVETDTFTLKNPVKTGYDFAGWTSENDTTKETTVSVEKGTTGDLKFTAHWTPKSYTITYVYNGGTEVQGDSFNGYGGAVKNDTGLVFTRSYGDAMPAFPTGLSLEKASVQPKDYTFDGWDNDYETKISGTVPAENVTFTAQYSETDRRYNVTAIVHNGTISNNSATGLWNFIWGKDVTVSYEPYEGYELSSVKVTKGDGEEEEVYANDIFKRYKDSYSINSLDADYTIEVTYTKIQYKVTFDLNGGKVGDSTDNIEQTVGWGEKATAPAPLKEEDAGYTYKLAGWKNGEVVYSGDTINNTEVKANVTYVAQWTPVAKEFKISYNGLEGASVSGNPTTYKIVSADIKLNNPSKTGYTFVGWDDDATEAEEKLKESDVAIQSGSTGDKSFTAIWKKNASTLQLNPNGGEFAEGTKTEYDGVYGDTLNNIPTPTRVGYTFDGWTKSVDFYGTLENGVYTFGATDGAVDVLTANWKNIEYTITFKNVYTDGQGNVDVVVATNHEGTYHYGDPVIRPTKEQEPTRRSTATENYTFAGWAAQENGTVLENIPDVTEDAIYYAVYKASPRYVGYTVQYYRQTERNNTDKETYEYVKADDVVVAYDATNNTAQAGSSLATDKLAEYAKKTYAGYAYDSTMTVNQGFSTNDDTNIVKLYYNLVDYKVVLDANGGTVQLSETEQKAYNDAKVYYEVDENGTTSELIYTVKSENFNLPVEPSISNMGQTFLGWKQVDAQGVWEAIVALFTPKAEVVTITVDADNSPVMTYKANWKGNTGTSLYVLLPGHELGKDINEVTAKERSGRKNFSSNYYTAKLGTVDVASNLTDTFKGAYYERQPDGDFGTSVEAYMSGHQYQNSSNLDGTTLKVNDYKGYSYTADINSVDWYVVKDSSTSNTPNWHVDGLPNWEKGAAVNYTLAIDLNDSDNYEASVEGEVYATKNGNPVNSTNTTYTVEDTVIITNPTRPGYTFEGWKAYYTNGGAQYKNYDGKVAAASVSKGTTGNLTFVAQWKADEYTIKYQTYNNATSAFINDNLATKSFNVENVADISFAVIAPAYDGLAFKGWYTEGGDLLTTETEIPTTSVLKQADPELKGAYQNATVVARYNDATMTVSAKDVTKVYSTYWMSSDVNPVASVEGATIQFFSEKKYYDQAVAGGAIEHIRKEGNMRVRDVDERTEYFVATKDGYEPAFGSAEFTITKRPLVLQANSATKKYDGKILSDTGYKVITETQNIDGVEVTGLEMPEYLGGNKNNPIRLTVVTEGSRLYAGTSSNVIDKEKVKIETTTVPEGRWGKDNSYEATNYEIYVLPGTLEVTPGEIAITVEASDDTKVYDGTALTANSYKALSEEDAKKLSEAGDHLVVTVEGSATLVSDSVAGNNKVTDVKVYHGDGTANDVTENYNINTQDGTLTITAKPIVLTAANVSKQYDGKPFDLSTLRNPVFTVADAAVDGEGNVVISDGHAIAEAGTTGVVGDQYVVPESVSLQVEPIVAGEGKTTLDASGIMIYAPAGVPMLLADDLDDVTGTMNDNYAIYYAPGKVSITNESLVEVALTAASGTYTYNGSAFTIDSYARTAQEGFDPDSAIDNWTFTVVDGEEEHEIQVNTSATAVGTYTVPFTYVNAAGEVVAVTEDDEIKVYDGVIGAEGTNDVTKYIKVTLVNGSILINAAPAQGGGGGGRRAAAATQTGDVLGARREDEALLEEGEVLGATRAPKTSDSAKAILWMLVMGGSALGAAAILAQRKKEEQK